MKYSEQTCSKSTVCYLQRKSRGSIFSDSIPSTKRNRKHPKKKSSKEKVSKRSPKAESRFKHVVPYSRTPKKSVTDDSSYMYNTDDDVNTMSPDEKKYKADAKMNSSSIFDFNSENDEPEKLENSLHGNCCIMQAS